MFFVRYLGKNRIKEKRLGVKRNMKQLLIFLANLYCTITSLREGSH